METKGDRIMCVCSANVFCFSPGRHALIHKRDALSAEFLRCNVEMELVWRSPNICGNALPADFLHRESVALRKLDRVLRPSVFYVRVLKAFMDYRSLVLGSMDSYDRESRRIFQHFLHVLQDLHLFAPL